MDVLKRKVEQSHTHTHIHIYKQKLTFYTSVIEQQILGGKRFPKRRH